MAHASRVEGPAGDPYDANGVDRSLVRWMLGLTPDERLAYVQASIDLQRSARKVTDADRSDSGDARQARS